MALLSRRSLVFGAVLYLPLLVAALGNSTYQDIDMLRSKLALMDDRPGDCPPW